MTKMAKLHMEQTPAQSPVDEILEIGDRMKRDRARLIELCGMVAALGAPVAPNPAVPVNPVNKVNEVPAEKIRKEPCRKVLCSICGCCYGTSAVGSRNWTTRCGPAGAIAGGSLDRPIYCPVTGSLGD